MPSRPDKPFAPPTAAQVERHLQRHPPRGPARLGAWMPILALGAVVGLMALSSAWLLGALPWALALAGIVFFYSYRVNALRNLEQRVVQVHELALLHDHPRTLRLAWRLLPEVTIVPHLHGRVVAIIALTLDNLRCHEAALAAYAYLLERLPADHPAALGLRLQQAMAQLANDQLIDADDTLRRLSHVPRDYPQTELSATWRLARLLQQAVTNHFDEAVEQAGDLIDQLRPLGIDAGFGHGLMALACLRQEQREAAQAWWSRATLLMTPGSLTHRYAPLREPASALTASPTSPAEAR